MNPEALKGKINKKDLQKKWWEIHDIISNPYNKVFPLNISETDGDETHEHVRTKKGKPKNMFQIIKDDRKPGEPMMTRSRYKQKNKII